LRSTRKSKEITRLEESAVVLKEILGMPEGIPKDLLDRSVCVVVYPSVKAAFLVGASYGRGVITCRPGKALNGPWSAPAMFAPEDGTFGFQIGAQATDCVLLIMNESGANSVISSKVKIDGDASAAAGGTQYFCRNRCRHESRNPFLFSSEEVCSQEFLSLAPQCAPMRAATRLSMERKSAPRKLFGKEK